MLSFSDWFSNFSVANPILWIAIATGLVVVLGFLFLGRKAVRQQPERIAPANGSASSLNSGLPQPLPIALSDERRRSIRRLGVPTALVMLDPISGRRSTQMEAYVLDRSSGGIRIAVEKCFPAGTKLETKPVHAPNEFAWVRVVVRNIREQEDYFELGCQFETELDLNSLLMFG